MIVSHIAEMLGEQRRLSKRRRKKTEKNTETWKIISVGRWEWIKINGSTEAKALITLTPTTGWYTLRKYKMVFKKKKKHTHTLLVWILYKWFLHLDRPSGTLWPPAPRKQTKKKPLRSTFWLERQWVKPPTLHATLRACISISATSQLMVQSWSYFRGRGDTTSRLRARQRVEQAQTTESGSVFQCGACHAESQSP